MPRIGLILLAAGGSSRLGQPKQLLRYNGVTLLRHAAETALESPCSPVVIVLGSEGETMAAELHGLDVDIVSNTDWQAGMGTSITAGIRALPIALDGVVIMLVDQPLVTSALLATLVHEYEQTGATIVASEYGGVAGVPALFDRSLFAELGELPPSEGARGLIKRRRAEVRLVPFDGGAADIDTAGDYAALSLLAG